MPDQEYDWLADEKWRTNNDAIFQSLIPEVAGKNTQLVPIGSATE
jgi:hypothetical protein